MFLYYSSWHAVIYIILLRLLELLRLRTTLNVTGKSQKRDRTKFILQTETK